MGSLFAWDVFISGKNFGNCVTGFYSDATPGEVGKQVCRCCDGKVMFLESKGNLCAGEWLSTAFCRGLSRVMRGSSLHVPTVVAIFHLWIRSKWMHIYYRNSNPLNALNLPWPVSRERLGIFGLIILPGPWEQLQLFPVFHAEELWSML